MCMWRIILKLKSVYVSVFRLPNTHVTVFQSHNSVDVFAIQFPAKQGLNWVDFDW